jgi:hypothetical protein
VTADRFADPPVDHADDKGRSDFVACGACPGRAAIQDSSAIVQALSRSHAAWVVPMV